MSITYEEALGTLESMFGSPWTRGSLDAVLRHHEGHMENTVESVLGHGDGDPAELVRRLQNPSSASTTTATTTSGGGGGGSGTSGGGGEGISVDEEIARQLAVGAPTEEDVDVVGDRTSEEESKKKMLSKKNNKKGGGGGGRGTPTSLPDDFLRIPGHKYADMMDEDEALARMLQDELFTQELKNNPEFAHLARGGSRGAMAAAAANNPRFGVRSSGVGGGFPMMRRDGAGAGAGGQNQEGPDIIGKLSEMGDNAKKRLHLLAAQWNARMKNQDGGGGGGGGNVPASRGGIGIGGDGARSERKGLLDDDDDDDDNEESSFLGSQRKDGNVEMRNIGGKKND